MKVINLQAMITNFPNYMQGVEVRNNLASWLLGLGTSNARDCCMEMRIEVPQTECTYWACTHTTHVIASGIQNSWYTPANNEVPRLA